jgi:cytidylate kinase
MWLLLKRYLKIEERDYIDTHRDNSPLVLAEDAIEIDNSHLTREEQFQIVLSWFMKLLKQNNFLYISFLILDLPLLLFKI